MNISVFGLGYVGCVNLGCLAKTGHYVIGVDINENKVSLINNGQPTIIEKDIGDIILKYHGKGYIRATKDSNEAVKNSDISLICVGTPSSSYGHLNLDYVYSVAEEIGRALKNKNTFHIIAIRSTVIPGSNIKVGEIVEKASSKKRNVDFGIISNPEFLREGSAVKDYYNPSLTILGSDNEKAMDIMASIYSSINAPIEKVKIPEAELIKYINNTFHALKVTFTNEIGSICKKLKIDSNRIMELFCMDKKLNISSNYLKPGLAYGGSCLPKDLKGLKTIAHDNYIDIPVISAIEESNSIQKKKLFELIMNTGKMNIGILGLSFKMGTDDLRNSPIVELVENLIGRGLTIKIFDANVKLSQVSGTNSEYIQKHIPHVSKLLASSMEEIFKTSEIVLVTQSSYKLDDICIKYPKVMIIDMINFSNNRICENYEGIYW